MFVCLIYLIVFIVSVNSQIADEVTCNSYNAQNCLNNYFNATFCEYDFPHSICSSTVNDICQNNRLESDCNDAFCFWDLYLQTCLASLPQVNSIYPCDYWTGYANTINTNQACAYHGCYWNNQLRLCQNTIDNSINKNETSQVNGNGYIATVNTQVQFINATVDTEDQLLSVFAVIPFKYTNEVPIQPEHPIFQILFPVNDISSWNQQSNLECSSFDPTAPNPQPFTTTVNVTETQQALIDSIKINKNFDFDLSTPIGQTLSKSLGHPIIQHNSITNSVSYDGSNFIFELKILLLNATSSCSIRGAQFTDDANGRIYTIPISYIQHSTNNLFSQVVQTYRISIPLTGVAIIGGSSTYGMTAYPTNVQYPKGPSTNCANGEGRIQLTFDLETYNVFDPTIRIGVFLASDILFRSPISDPGPVNCYGDQLANIGFSTVNCDLYNAVCKQTITIQSRCRPLQPSGDTFNLCQYSYPNDRIADMGTDIAYPSALDALHTFFVYRRLCPLYETNMSLCRIVSKDLNNYPDKIAAKIIGSSSSETSTSGNGFFVESGFLKSASANLADPNSLIIPNSPSNTTSGGLLSFELTDDITVTALMQLSGRQLYTLRIKTSTASTYITALTTDGTPLINAYNAVNQTFNGKTVLNYDDFRSSLKYITKSDFDQGCGVTGLCQSLPACNGILGCDGFTLPVLALYTLMPAPRYSITLNYQIHLPTQQTTPIARRLLQSNNDTTIERRDVYSFTINLHIITPPIVLGNNTNNCSAIQFDFSQFNQTSLQFICESWLQYAFTNGGSSKQTFLKGNLPVILGSSFVYLVFSYVSRHSVNVFKF